MQRSPNMKPSANNANNNAIAPPRCGAQIEVRSAMSISGRGAVLIGFVRSGAARVGQRCALLVPGGVSAYQLEVSSVERLSSMESANPAVGLVFSNPPPLEDLKLALPEGSILVLNDPV